MAQSRNRMHHRHRCHDANRSFLLEDFREGRYPNLQLNEIVAHVVEFALDYDGSKFIQRKLDDATEHRKDTVFQEIRPHLLMLMKHKCGNFVVQKFFEIGSEVHKLELLQLIQADFLALSLDKYGCRVVQTAIETSTMQYQYFIMQYASVGDFIQMAKNSNGNHVIQKCFRCVPLQLQDYIFDRLKNHTFELCLNLYGCRVMQCILIHGTTKHRSEIFNAIATTSTLLELIQDRYGNYVVQHAVQYCAPSEQTYLLWFIIEHVVALSQQKYASNVVEKCLSFADRSMANKALLAFICARRSNNALKVLCIDAFANYVVQKLIESADLVFVVDLMVRLQRHFQEMRRHVCGRKIIEELNKRVAQQNEQP